MKMKIHKFECMFVYQCLFKKYTLQNYILYTLLCFSIIKYIIIIIQLKYICFIICVQINIGIQFQHWFCSCLNRCQLLHLYLFLKNRNNIIVVLLLLLLQFYYNIIIILDLYVNTFFIIHISVPQIEILFLQSCCYNYILLLQLLLLGFNFEGLFLFLFLYVKSCLFHIELLQSSKFELQNIQILFQIDQTSIFYVVSAYLSAYILQLTNLNLKKMETLELLRTRNRIRLRT
eukprot:TRINITY_DN35789_c0_g1_i5.p1 TRINITY_DN35789_c0_g1~~TRINITY_DN35789_c0_g1_i5.p1  ORF type:complete len:232 (+),score=-25.25 TRINITY_DN35789_c0_g1_i5:189-884(+)